MPRVSHTELLSRLAKGKLIPALLLLGDEPYLRDACRSQLIERFVPPAARDWALSRYSAGRGETSQALEQAQTLPMLAPQQVVFLESVEAIEKLGEDLDQKLSTAAVLARSLAKEHDVEFAAGAAEDLAEAVAADLMRLKTEI